MWRPSALCVPSLGFIGIGETGLDYHYEQSSHPVQQESFRVHIEAARKSGLPLIVHTRDADEDTVRILEEEMKKGARLRGLSTASPPHASSRKKPSAWGFPLPRFPASSLSANVEENIRSTVKGVAA